jgi:hypothetical protein
MVTTWAPSARQHGLGIEMAGTGGTSLGKFTRTSGVARMHRYHSDSDEWGMWSALSGERIGEVRASDKGWAGYGMYETTGERWLEYNGPSFMAAVSAVLGKPGYGYSWYRVTRG